MRLLAVSVDTLEEAQKTRERLGLTFALAYGVDGPAFAAQTGAFYDAGKGFLQACGFVLRPDGRLAAALYSTGAVGRYTAADLLALLDHAAQKGH